MRNKRNEEKRGCLGSIIKKEVKELLTWETILPIVMIVVIFGMMGGVYSGVEEDVEEEPIIGLINNDGSGTYTDILIDTLDGGAELVYNRTDEDGDLGELIDEGLEEVGNEGGAALLIIPLGFNDTIALGEERASIRVIWILEGVGTFDSIPTGSVSGLLEVARSKITRELVGGDGGNVDTILAPFEYKSNETTMIKGGNPVNAGPGDIIGALATQSMLIPIMIMIVIMFSGGNVITSMGLEKENKTLETLLTLPVKRRSIITGKIVGSSAVGLAMALIYMLAYGFFMRGFYSSSDLNLEEIGLSLGIVGYLILAISISLAVLGALALCLVLGSFAKNYKSAQMLNGPLVALTMVPMFITMFKDFSTLPLTGKIVLFAIPFSHPMIASRALLFGDYLLPLSGLAYMAFFTLVMILIAVKIFNSDHLLVGRVKKEEEGKKRGIRFGLKSRIKPD